MAPELSYTLHYWPVIPGRGEFVRLAFESVGHSYKESQELAFKAHPKHFACPVLEIENVTKVEDVDRETKVRKVDEGKDVKTSSSKNSNFISQTSAILSYLAPILGLDGIKSLKDQNEISIAIRRAQVLQLTLTALDLNNEVHDTHHPVASSEVYEDQKEEALRRSKDFRSNRLPKFLTHFETTLKENNTNSGWLLGEDFTIADLTLFQLIDGLQFAFPKRMKALKKSGKYENVFSLHTKVSNLSGIEKYLKSERRREYSNGIFRHYPELDGED